MPRLAPFAGADRDRRHTPRKAVSDGHRARIATGPALRLSAASVRPWLGASTPSTCSSHGCHFARIVSTSAGVFP